ncbi:MAG: sugar-binding transcriptional regulator [Anaerolineae bacterium]
MRDDRLLLEVAKLHYEDGLTQAEIADAVGVSRVKVNRLLQAAREAGIVQFLVVPRIQHAYLRGIEDALKEAYNLRDVLLVPGREEILNGTLPQNTRQAIVELLARTAAEYLDRNLTNEDTLCVNWGRVMRSVVDHLRPTRPLPGLTVLPMLGILNVRADAFEANQLAFEIAAAYAADYAYLVAPAIVRNLEQKKVAVQLPLVAETLARIRQCTVAITAIAPADPVHATMVQRGWLKRKEVEALVARGAVGEICSWWFDAAGTEVRDDTCYPIGLGLDGLKRMVAEGKRVIAVVGADRERFAPLRAALLGRIVNVVITDHMTASQLLARAGDAPSRSFARP